MERHQMYDAPRDSRKDIDAKNVRMVQAVVGDTMLHLRQLNDWHEGHEQELVSASFPEWSILHGFVEYVIGGALYENLDADAAEKFAENPQAKFWIDDLLEKYGLETDGFGAWLQEQELNADDISEDELHDYCNDIDLGDLIDVMAREAFTSLFADRSFLSSFNLYIAGVVRSLDQMDDDFRRARGTKRLTGVPPRETIPASAREAVYARDRGCCTDCRRVLGEAAIANAADRYLYIVPPREGGIDDVGNLRLACESCAARAG